MSTPRSKEPLAVAVAAITAAVVVVVTVLMLLLSDAHVLIVLAAVLLVAVGVLAVRGEQRAQSARAALAAPPAGMEAIEDLRVRVRKLQEGLNNSSAPGPLRYVNKHVDQVFEQVQATVNLFALVDVKAAVPPLRNWAVSPDALLILLQEFLDVRPSLVVECGSGSSTLFLGLAAKQYGIPTRIVSLDHDEEYAAKTNRLLAAHGVDDIASARLAPLADVATDRPAQPWYAPSALDDLTDIGLVFVDGPPGHDTELARYPALPLMWDRLAPVASIVLDDTDRADEQSIIALWSQAHPELVGEETRTEKGTFVLRRR